MSLRPLRYRDEEEELDAVNVLVGHKIRYTYIGYSPIANISGCFHD